MEIIFWTAFVITVAEFIASPINVLRGSKIHLQRFREVRFPLRLAKISAVVELVAVSAVVAGVWLHAARLVGGMVLAMAFILVLVWALRAKRPAGDLMGLAFFIACALIVALY